MTETLRQRAEKRLSMLKNERSSWETNWRELSDFVLPMRSRVLNSEANKGDRRNTRIINNTATEAAGTSAAGMMSGQVSRSRPWFNIEVRDKESLEFGPIKSWLFDVTQRMRDSLLRSNFYNAIHVCYLEMVVFGTAAMWIDQDDKNVIRCEAFTAGEYYVANGVDGKANTFYREFKMTAAQMAEKFGRDKLSDAAKTALDASRGDQWFDCVQMVEPNQDYAKGSNASKKLAFASLVWEKASPPEKTLEHKGFHEFPVVVMRWDVLPGDCYGTSPARRCLGDIKALQLYERSSARLAETGSNPALMAPVSLKNTPHSSIPGSITYVDQVGGQNTMAPIYQPNYGWMQAIEGKIARHEQRINRTFYVDLFLMISQMDDVRTATEIAARKEEKMAMLGPVVERVDFEALDPIIERLFNIMTRQSLPIWSGVVAGVPLLPEPPEEMQDMEVEADYISILAQAQKAQAVTSLERFASMAGNLSAVFPEVRDKVNSDQFMDEYGEAIGVVPTVVRGDDEVDAIRQQRQQQAAQQQAEQQMANMTQGAKILSDTEITPDNALGRIMGA